MAPTALTVIPAELTAGQTWKFRLGYGDFPAGDGWALALYFRGAGTLDATMGDDARIVADGNTFVVTIAPADSGIPEGVYEYLAEASLAGETYTAATGSVRVRPKLSSAAAGDRQSFAESMLTAVKAELAARITGDGLAHESHQIGTAGGGRQLQLLALNDLRKLQKELEAELLALRYKGRLPYVDVAFGPADG